MGRSRLLQPLPWYQWNPVQWQASRKVQRMDWAARGLYRELMDECWLKGSVPSTVSGIADLFGVDESEIEPLLPQIIKCFDVVNGSMTSPFIEEIRTEVDARRVIQANRRLGKDKHGEPRLTTDSTGEPEVTEPNQSEVVEKSREEKEKEVPPFPPAGEPKGRRRVKKQDEFQPFPPEVKLVVNALNQEWPRQDPDGQRDIRVSPAQLGGRILEILNTHRELTAELLIEAGRAYIRTRPSKVKAPQYFFGPEGPWGDFVHDVMTRQAARASPPHGMAEPEPLLEVPA